jgi:hypothetical protein
VTTAALGYVDEAGVVMAAEARAGGGERPVRRVWLAFWAVVVSTMYVVLWSPHWYPLSDSSLYLSMARSWAHGKGLTMMGDPVRLVPPLTPVFMGTLIKWGAGIGALQAVMIGLMLVAHAFCFLTLRRWVGERLALGATLAAALSYWVFANAFTIMSEPLCIALLWLGFWALSYVGLASRWRWWLVVVVSVLLVLAAANRDAIFLLLPGPLLAVMMRARADAGGRWAAQSIGWAAVFGVAIGGWFFYRYPPKFILSRFTPRPATLPTTGPATGPTTEPVIPPIAGINPEYEAEPESGLREGRYKGIWLQGVPRNWHMVTDPPVLGGRWVCEGLVMASVAVFEAKGQGAAPVVLKVFGVIAALVAFVLTIAGGVILLRRRHWWVIGVALYFAFIWLQWGTRIKPRYMIPLAPLLYLLLWTGVTWAGVLVGRRWRRPRWDEPGVGRVAMYGLVGLVFLGNAFPWAVEWYVRHGTGREFYDGTRRAAYAQLVDIGAYAQANLRPDDVLWMNAGAYRRIAHFLSGHKIETSELAVPNWKSWESLIREAKDVPPTTQPIPPKKHMSVATRRRLYFNGLGQGAKYIIVFVEHPKAGESWPGWHLPMRPDDPQTEWWRLYERQPDNTWRWIRVPRNRGYVDSIPAIPN